ncbi:carboxypeptidase D [Ilyonectria robusta]
MPFRYVKTEDGKPIMPKVQGSPTCVVDGLNADRASQGMVELIQKDADKAVNDLF